MEGVGDRAREKQWENERKRGRERAREKEI